MKIAIIEDERKLAETLAEGLQTEGYETVVFHDGESFIQMVAEAAFDLVVLDLGLPRMNGTDVSLYLRTRNILVPILVLTANDTVADKVIALDSGADDFLAKPFNFDELLARLRALLRRAAAQGATTIVVEDLTVDLRTRSVQRAGGAIELTPTEFDLLCLLLQYRTQPLSRDEISKSIWDVRDASLSNIVDVHISNLRKKIDESHTTKLISTVRGLGYQIA